MNETVLNDVAIEDDEVLSTILPKTASDTAEQSARMARLEQGILALQNLRLSAFVELSDDPEIARVNGELFRARTLKAYNNRAEGPNVAQRKRASRKHARLHAAAVGPPDAHEGGLLLYVLVFLRSTGSTNHFRFRSTYILQARWAPHVCPRKPRKGVSAYKCLFNLC